MIPSSSKLPKKPVKMKHLACGTAWDMYAAEWPPKIAVCTNCGVALRLATHDPNTHTLTYRRIH